MQTLGLYIQIPFCASKCSFCNFSSKVGRAQLLERYCAALRNEIEGLSGSLAAQGVAARSLDLPVDTIYLGGGTPPLLGVERLREIVRALSGTFHFGRVQEFTLEVTPGSADDEFLAEALKLGVNRLSIGAQSFDDRELAAVGRLHSADETRKLVLRARRAGYANISLDLIAGLPHQAEASWLDTLRSTLDLAPDHVSVYIFEVDEKSRLGGEVLRHGNRYHAEAVPEEDFMAEAYNAARHHLAGAGYSHYEISNFALPGHESLHNRKYWQLAPYIGVGAGAHSFDGHRRWANVASPEIYADRLENGISPVAEMNLLSPTEQLEEFYFLGLRQRAGVEPELARRRWGATLAARWEPS
ncbi:MAG: radical SAM family heme chaperone HemW, partial [Acidobacteria bacterium]|nr:radical SAM family heme chaperone HemW [Acidobacteriota bacterium]